MRTQRVLISSVLLLAALLTTGCTESAPPAPTSRPSAEPAGEAASSTGQPAETPVLDRGAETAAPPPVPGGSVPDPVASSGSGGGSGGDSEYALADLTNVPIPDEPARGKVNGVPFTVERATLQNGVLELRQGSEFFPDRAFTIFLFTDAGETLDGRWFSADPAPAFGSSTPHIHMNYMIAGEQLPETEMFMRGHAMRLDFGATKDGRLPGSIYLCVPDEAKSYVVGTFEAEIETES